VSLEEFKRKVIERANLETTIKPGPAGAFVFISAHDEDLALAEEISEVLEKHTIASTFPERQETGLKELEQYVLHCDGVIVVYGNVNVIWTKKHLMWCHKMLYRREAPLKIQLAVFEGPPEGKETLHVKIPGMHIIDCQAGICEEKFEPFLKELRAGGSV
jgi:hypothetical protein